MEVDVHEKSKIVAIWLTNAEKNDQELKAGLQSIYDKYSKEKYTVAVFESGSQNLYENTLALLRSNRDRMAEKDVKQAKSNTPKSSRRRDDGAR